MTTLAIFSDVHGNLPAFQAVLQDIADKNVDQVYCLGDLVDYAPWPNEVIALIQRLRIPCLLGNHDERIAFDHAIRPLAKHGPVEAAARLRAIHHTKHTVTATNKAYLAGLPRQLAVSFHIAGRDQTILLVHASTRRNDEYIYENHDLADVQQMLAASQADVLVMGHTHVSYVRPIPATAYGSAKQAINCGSVGRPKDSAPLASYALLQVDAATIEAQIMKVAYPVAETVAGIRRSGIPAFYADSLLG